MAEEGTVDMGLCIGVLVCWCVDVLGVVVNVDARAHINEAAQNKLMQNAFRGKGKTRKEAD